MARRREEIRAQYKGLGYIEWLKKEGERGNIHTRYALRKCGEVAPVLVNIAARDLRDAKLIAGKIVHVTGRGTLFYKAGEDVFRDNGSHLSLKKDSTDQGVKAALMITMAKFDGQPLVVNGTEKFKERCIEVEAKAHLPISFSDAQMDKSLLLKST